MPLQERNLTNHEKMHLHPFTLVFHGKQKHLENDFLDDYFKSSLSVARISCLVVFLIYALFGILDQYLFPEQKEIFWLFRYTLFCPLSLVVFFVSYSSLFQKRMQAIISGLGILAGAGVIAMIVLAPPPVSYSYYAGLILVFMAIYTLSKLRFIWANITCWLLLVMYEYAAIVIADTPAHILINNIFFFLAANAIGMFSCYTMEYSARLNFFMQRQLEEEREQVQHARQMLEERVTERTKQLVDANIKITREMNERIQAEEDKRQVQTELLRHQKMESLGLMAGGVAHDLNNILSGIISYPELILLDLPEDSNLKQPILEIKKSGVRAAAVVADLLTMARGVASKHEIVCINDLVKTYLSSPEHKEQASFYPRINFKTNLEPDLPDCKCSPVHIQKILMNLVNNAFEAIPQSGTITLSTSRKYITDKTQMNSPLDKGDYLLICVQDDGSGISKEALQHIFEPFYTKKEMGRSGTGLGLAVVWSTVQEHRGTVDVKSDEQGSTFTVYLPVTQEKMDALGSTGKNSLQGTASILVVDDEKIQRDISSKILTQFGYDVHTVQSGEHAITYLQKHSTDLILLDMLMPPGLNGYQTYKEISLLHPGQKAIIVSGFSKSAEVQATLQLGANDFLKKPYSMEQLGKIIKQVLQ